jgi:hypothetical protein
MLEEGLLFFLCHFKYDMTFKILINRNLIMIISNSIVILQNIFLKLNFDNLMVFYCHKSIY